MSRLLSNNKVLLFIIAVLLVTNIALIIAFFSARPPGGKWDERGPGSPGEAMALFLKNDVKFSAEQLKQFDSLRKEHRRNIKPLFRKISAVKDGFYRHIYDDVVNDSLLSDKLDSISLLQKQLDRGMFYHFRNVRTLCTPEQLPVYDSLVQRFVKRMTTPFRKPAPHGKDTTGFYGR